MVFKCLVWVNSYPQKAKYIFRRDAIIVNICDSFLIPRHSTVTLVFALAVVKPFKQNWRYFLYFLDD